MTFVSPDRCDWPRQERLAKKASDYIFHHVFLPPKLPQEDDCDPECEMILLEELIAGLRRFISYLPSQDANYIQIVISMFEQMKRVRGSNGGLIESELTGAMKTLTREGSCLPIYVKEQNAGVLMSRQNNKIQVESFELSPRNESVISTVGRLLRTFPGPAIALNAEDFDKPGFLDALGFTLALMSHQPVAGMKPKVKKAKQKHDEDRDTTDPKMITEFFMSILRPLSVDIDAMQIRKHTRQEVMWRDSRSPWKRSAFWLFLRVTLQLILNRSSVDGHGANMYKEFMIFFLCGVLRRVPDTTPSEMVFLMNAKVTRRLIKLNSSSVPRWLPAVRKILRQASNMTNIRWKEAMNGGHRDVSLQSLSNLNFRRDIACGIANLDQYIVQVGQRKEKDASQQQFHPLPKLHRYFDAELPDNLDLSDKEYSICNLAAIEQWVALNLGDWITVHQAEEQTCSQLAELMTSYHKAALPLGSKNPEAFSAMILTVLELWVACDKSATCIHPLLADYDPCVPLKCFQSLLLPLKSQMERLATIEEYLERRLAGLLHRGSGVFHDFGTPSCFSVRYFDRSLEHQQLFTTIEDHASEERAQKMAELQQKQTRYRFLMDLFKDGICDFVDVVVDKRHNIRQSRHSNSCSRHSHKKKADSMQISVHEWPLPSNLLQAKSTVFELQLPEPFGSWRDITLYLLSNCLGVDYATKERPSAQYRPQSYLGLSRFFALPGHTRRIGLLSQSKPHQRTHRRDRSIPSLAKEDICVNNGLHFRYYDETKGSFVGAFQGTGVMEKSCMYQLPQHSSALQRFLFRPAGEPHGPSPNTVIATQNLTPANLSLGEYKSLATMPLGLEIQWQNILLELSSSALDWKKIETALFVLQIINQAGPTKKETVLRLGHAIIADEDLASALLRQISELKERIQENWETIHGLNSLVSLSQRVLSLSPSKKIRESCLHSLQILRQTAFRWLDAVRRKITETVDAHRKSILVGKAVHIALVCTETFNIECPSGVIESPSELSIFLQCSIAICNGEYCFAMDPGSLGQILHRRWRLLTFRLSSFLATSIVEHGNPGMDLAVSAAWVAYQPGRKWIQLPDRTNYWLVTRGGLRSGSKTELLVHYNLLTGELLVDGVPVARLPSDYESHETYRILFGKCQLEVMPSNLPGMHFSCQSQYAAHTVHLAKDLLSGGSVLFVTAVKDGNLWEFVPANVFNGVFPDDFIQNYVHWYNVDGRYIEFRPKGSPWASSRDNWHLRKLCLKSDDWRLEKQGQFLMSRNSQTADLTSNILQALEDTSKMLLIYQETSSAVHVKLPRVRLDFLLKPDSPVLQSRQYPGMVVDKDQSLGSLIGLKNKLILARPGSDERVILIPEGPVSWTTLSDHLQICIDLRYQTQIHAYSIDVQLGRLVDNGSLLSKLFLAYLHATTSFCLPDPLTAKTGTEQALSILRSAAVRSFDRLNEKESALLTQIAYLTPQRRYYPANERVMQSVVWNDNLHSLSQHEGFLEAVISIRDQNRRQKCFYPIAEYSEPSVRSLEPDLVLRDRIRTSSYRVSGFGAEQHTRQYDINYQGQDVDRMSPAASRSYAVCDMIFNEISRIREIGVEGLSSRLWELLSTSTDVLGPKSEVEVDRLGYDSEWMRSTTEYLVRNWCPLHNLALSKGSNVNKFHIMIWLSTIAFSGKVNMILIETVASFFAHISSDPISPPNRRAFHPASGCQPDRPCLIAHIKAAELAQPPESDIFRLAHETYDQFIQRKQRLWQSNMTLVRNRMVSHLEREWPSRTPAYLAPTDTPMPQDYLDVRRLMTNVGESFNIWANNAELRTYIIDLATSLCDHECCKIEIFPYGCPTPPPERTLKRGFITFQDRLKLPPTFNMRAPSLDLSPSYFDQPTGVLNLEESNTKVLQLINLLALQATSEYETWYAVRLKASATSLQKASKGKRNVFPADKVRDTIIEHLEKCKRYAQDVYCLIMGQLCPTIETSATPKSTDCFEAWVSAIACECQLFPRLSPLLMLEQLSGHRWKDLSDCWKRYFIQYGCSITALQRAERLASLLDKPEDLVKEIQNPGHVNWSPIEFPETLLLEIENRLLIRGPQEDIACVMRNAASERNLVMQLNMGEGKSSVVVPMVANFYADGHRLARVIVAKPQSRQMLQMLIGKLGGLLDRRIYHMPVSRSLKLGESEIHEIEHMCAECRSQGGVMLVQPEHILSLKLMCLESFVAGKMAVGRGVRRILKFFQDYACDIVDESDENFNVKFELIYTMGAQQPVELSPQRWLIIQEILSLVRDYAGLVACEDTQSIEVEENSNGGFPRLRLLNQDGEACLVKYIGRHICEKGIQGLPISRQPRSMRDKLLIYITKPNPIVDEIDAVERDDISGFWGEDTRNALLLVRGLLAGGVLTFCLRQKRWRVNYGADNRRKPPTRLSVPYRAKDCPSLRSEFSHPDVVILLTCLHYYYAGLTDEDMVLSFNELVKSDQADVEYQEWVAEAPKLPSAYCQLVGVNLEDQNHCKENIFPYLRFSKGAVDSFLDHVVFPKELKTFPHKLSSSGWDIGEIKTHPTVGFSGTNDSQRTLPLSIHQLDIPEQSHTNALVLGYLLQEVNSVAYLEKSPSIGRSDAEAIINQVMDLVPQVRVILDVGAQILELGNQGVAQYWLSQFPAKGQVQAVVFVDEHDEICVVDRSGQVDSLQVSPYAQQMESCLVFLDESHTRGIDLKLPVHYRAAVTLGPRITKDKLVQACMRMRKLGFGQSVVFCIPSEIQNRIIALREPHEKSFIDVFDVLHWAVIETWADMRHSIPLWAVQGMRFQRQEELWENNYKTVSDDMTTTEAGQFLEAEAQTIEERYRPGLQDFFSRQIQSSTARRVNLITQRCQEFDKLEHSSSFLHEEQERELAPEIVSERQVQRPPQIEPESHEIHPDVRSFIATGVLKNDSVAYRPAFQTLWNTSISKLFDVNHFPADLLATKDFFTTVRYPSGSPSVLDNFQRAVRWILTSKGAETPENKRAAHLVIISPYEANQLMVEIRNSRYATLHLYAPRQNRGYAPLDMLKLYNVPSNSGSNLPDVLRIQLNLFSGQLYFNSYPDYQSTCDFLGVASLKTSPGSVVAADGFILHTSNQRTRSVFRQSPLKFIGALMSQIRKDCQEIGKTHIGQIVQGCLLSPTDFPDLSSSYVERSLNDFEKNRSSHQLQGQE